MTTIDPVRGPVRADADALAAFLALGAGGILREFNQAGVLAAADVHVARRIGALYGEEDEAILLAIALAVRAPRIGHVCTDIETVSTTATSDLDDPVDVDALPWPTAGEWRQKVSESALAAVGVDGPADRPLRLVGGRLYLDRYWREERAVAADLVARSGLVSGSVDDELLAGGLHRLFPPDTRGPGDAGQTSPTGPDLQRLAGAVAVLGRFSVVAGGPGTGKTTTVARILALLDEQARAASTPPPRIALAAPTGKAAARLGESVHEEMETADVSSETRASLAGLEAMTLHRLLGWRPDTPTRPRHNGNNPLPYDLVVVDETSMVSLSLMARLLDALGSDARLVLVGDPSQLASVEAGAVLGDIVGPAGDSRYLRTSRLPKPVAEAVGSTSATGTPTGSPTDRSISDGIVVLQRNYRSEGDVDALARVVRAEDADAAIDLLHSSDGEVRWVERPVASDDTAPVDAAVREEVVEAGRRVAHAAGSGDAEGALDALGALRVLCAHRRGPYGVATCTRRIERWLVDAIPGYGEGRWYGGQPLLVTRNDYGLRLFNGDTGVVVNTGGDLRAVFRSGGELRPVVPTRLESVETVHAMTVHKSQGSEFDSVVVILPDPDSRILSRELLYTAITRAKKRLVLVAPEESIRAAVTRGIARSSGLRDALWA